MVFSFKKSLIALGLIATFSGIAVTDADARHRGRHHHVRGGYNSNVGPAIALGLFGALAAGAIIHNQSQQRPSYYYQDQPHYGYAPQGYYQQPQYIAPRPRTGHVYYETRYDAYGNPYNVRRVCNERYPNNPSGSCH